MATCATESSPAPASMPAIMAPDAAFCVTPRTEASRLYLFKDRRFASWDVAADALLPGYPRDIEDEWPGLLDSSPGTRLRAALHVPEWGEKVYFIFEGQRDIVAWDLATATIEPRRIPSADLLPCDFPPGEFTPVVAMTAASQRVIYGFHQAQYVRWTVGRRPLPAPDAGFPRNTADDWKDGLYLAPRTGVYVDWPNRSSAHSNRKIYFFMGNLYLRWDVPSNSRNYRLDVATGWKGWPAFR